MLRFIRQLVVWVFALSALCLFAPGLAVAAPQSGGAPNSQVSASLSSSGTAQNPSPDSPSNPQALSAQGAPPDGSDSPDPVTLFPHSATSRYWISGQANIILQWHPPFH